MFVKRYTTWPLLIISCFIRNCRFCVLVVFLYVVICKKKKPNGRCKYIMMYWLLHLMLIEGVSVQNTKCGMKGIDCMNVWRIYFVFYDFTVKKNNEYKIKHYKKLWTWTLFYNWIIIYQDLIKSWFPLTPSRNFRK